MDSSGLDFFLPSGFRGELHSSIRVTTSLPKTRGALELERARILSCTLPFPPPPPYSWGYLWYHPHLHTQSPSASRARPVALGEWALTMPTVLKPFQPPPQNRPDTHPPSLPLAQSQNFCLPSSAVRPAVPFLLGWERWREMSSLQLNQPLVHVFSPYVYMPYVNMPYMCQQIDLRHLF